MKTAEKIREIFHAVEGNEYSASQYFTATNTNGNLVKIRVSNHSANSWNNDMNTLSFVTAKNAVHQGFRKGNMTYNEFVLVDGDPIENWETLEDLLEYHDIDE